MLTLSFNSDIMNIELLTFYIVLKDIMVLVGDFNRFTLTLIQFKQRFNGSNFTNVVIYKEFLGEIITLLM